MRSFDAQLTDVEIPVAPVTLRGHLQAPPHARGLVLFVHGSGSSRNSPRNQRIAEYLHDVELATLLFDLISSEEELDDTFDRRLRFNVDVLAERVRGATRWARQQPETAELLIGYFGAGTGAAAALLAAAAEGSGINAVVTRGGHTDLAANALKNLHTPTMLIVGGDDTGIAALNLETWAQLHCEKSIEIVPGVGHSFEEPGALENVAVLATRWFADHLRNDAIFR